jgi:transposase
MKRTIGIDLAIRGDQVAQIFDDGKPVGKAFRFRLASQSLDDLVERATADLPAGATVQALMEPTGMSWFPVACRLTKAGITVIRVKGQRVRALRRYLSEHAKTDAADAKLLASMPLYGGLSFDPIAIPSPKAHALQRLTKQRSRYQDVVCSSKRRLIDLVRWAAPSLEDALPDFRTRLSLAILRDWFDPNVVLKARKTTLARFIAMNASGNHPHSGPFVDQLIEKLKAAAAETIALHLDDVDFAELQAELAIEVDILIRHLDAISVLDRRIEALYRELHPVDALRTIPGIGDNLAPVLLGVFHHAGRFRSERQIRGFCGLFPNRSSSGGMDRPGQQLTKAGNDRVKKALYLAADSARRIDPHLAALYCRLMTVKGHHHKQALCAVANRLVNRIYSVMKSGKAYVLRDLAGNPITVAQAKEMIERNFTIPPQVRNARRVTRTAPAG